MASRPLNAKQQRSVAIYTLSGPDGAVRYVGKTNNPTARLRLGSKANLPVARWVRSLGRQGAPPEMSIIEWTDDWEAAERRWIASYRATHSLLNLADGGAGVPGIVDIWALRNAAEYAQELLDRIKPFAMWLAERKRTGCEVLLYWGVFHGLQDVRAAALRAGQ